MPHTNSRHVSAKRVALHRQKSRRKGLTRLEVTVPRSDAMLMRHAAKTLRQGGSPALRLREHFSQASDFKIAATTKEMLAFFQNSLLARHAIDLNRDRTPIQDVDF